MQDGVMATIAVEEGPVHSHKLGVLRLALTGAIATAITFVPRWAGTFVPFSSPAHALIPLFPCGRMG
jgi:hypothetical protein